MRTYNVNKDAYNVNYNPSLHFPSALHSVLEYGSVSQLTSVSVLELHLSQTRL